MDITVRPGRPEECARVLALLRQAEATPSATDTLPELARLVADHPDALLVALANHVIVGTVIAGWDGWRGNIYRLAVTPEFRRQGVARALVAEAARRLEAKGVRRISALVEHESPLAVGFWDGLQEAGWERDPRYLRYVKALGGS